MGHHIPSDGRAPAHSLPLSLSLALFPSLPPLANGCSNGSTILKKLCRMRMIIFKQQRAYTLEYPCLSLCLMKLLAEPLWNY